MSRMMALLTAFLLGFALTAGGQEPPKPPKPPKPGQADPPKPPVKRSYFCTGKSDGWYCGENDEPKLFLCRNGFIETGKDCAAGCDTERNRCKKESK